MRNYAVINGKKYLHADILKSVPEYVETKTIDQPAKVGAFLSFVYYGSKSNKTPDSFQFHVTRALVNNEWWVSLSTPTGNAWSRAIRQSEQPTYRHLIFSNNATAFGKNKPQDVVICDRPKIVFPA